MSTGSLTARLISQKRTLAGGRLQSRLRRKTVRQRLIRYGLVAANVLVLGGVVAFVAIGTHSGATAVTGTLSDSAVANPVDGQTAYDIAANVARMTDLPESTAVLNQAQTAQTTQALSVAASNIVEKPQIIATALKSKDDIFTYVTQPGDTLSSLSQKFNITTNSIIWSNNLSAGQTTVSAGTKLTMPPITGIVYAVKAGDTIDSLAAKYSVTNAQLIASNDAEIGGIYPGEQILIPNGQVQAISSSGLRFSYSPVYGATTGVGCARYVNVYPCLYGSNGYDPGWCTWYVASRVFMPSNWGNASNWARAALLSGWTVSQTPKVGAIVQTTRGNHVGYVEAVSDDGTQVKYSDMNGLAGFANVGFSGWVPTINGFDGGKTDTMYIYH